VTKTAKAPVASTQGGKKPAPEKKAVATAKVGSEKKPAAKVVPTKGQKKGGKQ